jgi:hypothetical protein
MSQRINISVPDDLYQKIQTFKERLHVSRICQEALLRAIRIEEMRSQVDDDIEQLAIVFKEERKEYSQKFYEEGFRDGMKDAFKTDYEWMCQVAYRRDAPPEEVFEIGASKDTDEKLANNAFETADMTDDGYLLDDAHDFYVEGWVAGFIDVWYRVCAKLSIHDSKEGEEAPHGDE